MCILLSLTRLGSPSANACCGCCPSGCAFAFAFTFAFAFGFSCVFWTPLPPPPPFPLTGETLCDQKHAVILEKMDFPEPVIKVAVEPKTKGDQQKMSEALVRLAAEDPSFRFSRDEETGQTIIEGMGELHLEIIVDRMKREFNVE